MELMETKVEYKGYTAVQSSINHHVMIFDKEGRMVAHIQKSTSQTEAELKSDIDFLLTLPDK